MRDTIIWGLVGSICWGLAIWQYQISHQVLTQGVKSMAEVVDLIPVYDSEDENYTYRPVFKFKDQFNNRQEYEASWSSSPPPYEIGEYVEVGYDPISGELRVLSFWGLYTWSFICGLLASIFSFIAYFRYKNH